MLYYILRRLVWMIVILLGIVSITFLVTYIIPGDPARLIAGPKANAATIASIRHELGLDLPLWQQYINYIGNMLQGDFGESFLRKAPVLPAILEKLPFSVALAIGGVSAEILIGVPIGIISALKPGSIWDRGATIFGLLGLSSPPFWLGLLLIFYFGYIHSWFPLGGVGSPLPYYLILPWITVGINGAAMIARMVRSTMLDILRSSYMQMARAKGLPGGIQLWRHAIPNIVVPIITMIGMDLGYFLGGILIIEVVFGIPGIGGQAWEAINVLDIPMIIGTVFISALFIVFMNFIVDISYKLIDPRIRIM